MTRALGWGAALIAASLALGVPATMGMLDGVDRAVLKALALSDARSPGWTIDTMRAVTWFGDPAVRSLFIILGLVVLAIQRRLRLAAIYVLVAGLSIFGHGVAKEVFGRERPMVVPWLDDISNLSYPSGHAAGAMVVLLLAALLINKRWLVVAALVLALAIGVSRVLLGVHWPSDVVGGWIYGGGAALIGYAVAERIEVKKVEE